MTSRPGSVLLFGLLGLFIFSNIAALVWGKPDPARLRRAIPWLQRSTSLQLAVMAWLFWLIEARGAALSTFSVLVAAGMTISFVADLIMAGAIPSPNHVLSGMIVFGLAHGVYILAFLSGGQALDQLSLPALVICVILMGAVSAGLWDRVIRGARAGHIMTGASLAYTLFLGTMVAAAVAVAGRDGRIWLLPLGATLFMVSDIILGHQIFRRSNWPYVHEIVWLTYAAGQACIVWSNYQALAAVGSA